MESQVSVVDCVARVQQRSRSSDPQWGSDPYVSQTLVRPIGASSELSLTLDPARDPNLISWEVVLARGDAFRIPRVSIPHQSACLCPSTHLTSSGAGLTPGEPPWSSHAPDNGVEVMLSFSLPPKVRRPPRNPGRLCWTGRAPIGRMRWASGA